MIRPGRDAEFMQAKRDREARRALRYMPNLAIGTPYPVPDGVTIVDGKYERAICKPAAPLDESECRQAGLWLNNAEQKSALERDRQDMFDPARVARCRALIEQARKASLWMNAYRLYRRAGNSRWHSFLFASGGWWWRLSRGPACVIDEKSKRPPMDSSELFYLYLLLLCTVVAGFGIGWILRGG